MAMEQHPVPQNITTFQFRLIGDMTIKQFAYLAGGAIVAYVSYKLPLPFFITWPLAIFSGLLGFGLAFVPVEERPMDVWILSFLKNTYNPTQFIWQQHTVETKKQSTPQATSLTARSPSASAQDSHAIHTLPEVTPAIRSATKPDIISQSFASLGTWVTSFFSRQHSFSQGASHDPSTRGPATMLSSHREATLLDNLRMALKKQKVASDTKVNTASVHQEDTKTSSVVSLETISIPAPVKIITKEEPSRIKKLENEISSLSSTTAQKEHQHVEDLKTKLATLLEEKKHMNDELEKFKREASIPRPIPVYQPSAPSASVHIASPSSPQGNSGVPRLTTFQNVATGIIKDSKGNMLPGILVTIKDQEGVPLRALKTNKLGQFAASTPLQPGEYVIEIEDPRNQFAFDKTHVVINNSVLPAVEIIAKSQKEISRAKLAMDIFGTNI